MPQVDLEALVCGGGGGGGGDGKVACESSAAAKPEPRPPPPPDDPDLPAESFIVPISDEIDWVDVNAVYDRDDSTKGNTNPKSTSHHQPNPKPGSNSNRFSGNLKPPTKGPILGLPNKLHHSALSSRSSRRPPTNSGRIFPKKSRRPPAGAKSAVPELEPSSPKVSCFGKVLSEREREKFRQNRRRQSPPPERAPGCLAGIFPCGRPKPEEGSDEQYSFAEPVGARPAGGNIPADDDDDVAKPAAVPGLGAVKRFASGRKSWAGLDEEGDGHVDDVWARRSIGSIEDDLERTGRVGSTSV